MSKKLVDIAKGLSIRVNKRNNIDKDVIDLAISWLKDEIGTAQASKAYNQGKGVKSTGNVLYTLAVALKEAYKRDLITLK